MLPAAVVDGVGATIVAVPPVATVYHLKFVPVAVSGVAVAPWQKVTAPVTFGAVVAAFTFTVIVALGLSHPLDDWLT